MVLYVYRSKVLKSLEPLYVGEQQRQQNVIVYN